MAAELLLLLQFTVKGGKVTSLFAKKKSTASKHVSKMAKGAATRLFASSLPDVLLNPLSAFKFLVTFVPEAIAYFDICSGKKMTINEILKLLRKLSKKEISVVYNKKVVPGDDWAINKNYKKAESVLGWRPTVDMTEGLKVVLEK